MTTVADRPDDEVYKITRAVFERKSELIRAVAAFERFGSDFVLQGFRTPLHPGARRYWRECGLLAAD
ncbi:MAG: TAXI family TRAP transporter solute-binding subunit [Pseudomonadota bacterium]